MKRPLRCRIGSGWQALTRPLLAAALLAAASLSAAAQTTVLPNPATASNFSRFPFSTGNGYVRTAIIYRAADIRAAGGTISQLEFIQYNASTPGAVPLKVYLKATPNTQFTTNTTVAAEEAGATLVYDATLPASAFTPATANNTATYTTTIPLSTTFAYNTCDNLEVIIETNATGTGNETANGQRGGTVDGKATIYSADGGGGRVTTIAWFADNAAPTGVQQVNNVGIRPMMRVTGLTATAAPDAGVLQLLTQNKVLVTSAGGATQVVKAQVRNYGAALTGVPVTLTLTGPGGFSYTNTKTVALAANALTTVTFDAYTPSTTAGTGTISVAVAATGDTYACNNTMTEAQAFSDTDISYITPGVFSPGGRGFGATAFPNAPAFSARFTTLATRNMTAVRVRLSNSTTAVGQTVYGVLLNATTGAIIARSADYVIQASDLDGLTTHEFAFTAPATLAAGTYNAGMAQTYPNGTAANYFPMGTQPEYQGRGGAFYTNTPTTPTVPTDIGTATATNYKFPIELVTATAPACGAVTGVTAGSITSTSASIAFTAPGGATDYTVTATPAGGGTAVTATPAPTTSPAALTGLQPNTTYNVTVVSNCAGGLTSSSATTTFTTSPTTDASVVVLYSMGQLPIPYGAPHAVQALLRNSGATATTVPATLTVTGPGGFSFTDTQTSASLATNATGLVTFAGYTPTTAGTYTITVTTGLAGDQIASNDTRSQTQAVNPTTFSYSAATPVVSGSVGFGTGGGALVAKFTTNAPRLVTAVKASLSASAVGQTVYGVLLSSTGALLGRSNNFVATAAGTVTFTLQTPVTLPAGAFHAGLAQVASTTSYFPLNVEAEAPTRTGAYFTTAIGGGTPTDAAASNLGRFIVEAVTADVPTCSQVSGLTLTTRTDTSLGIGFTVPTGTTGATYTVTLTPTTGAPLTQTVSASPATFTGLTPGTTYTVSVVTDCGGTAGTSAATTGTASTLGNLVVSTAQTVGGSYYNVTVTSTGSITGLTADLNVAGVMTVQSGGSVTTDAISFYIRGAGRFVLEAGATLNETNNAGITNTGTGGFLLTGTNPVQLSTDANYVFTNTSAQVTGALLPAQVRNLTVNNAAGLTLTNSLRVAQRVRLQSGNLVLNGKSLVLLSDASGTALIDNTGGVVTGATGMMQRAITSSYTAVGYRHFSSPVSGSRIDTLSTGGMMPVVNAAYNASATPGFVTPFPTVFGYDETRIASTTSNFTDFNKGWFSPAGGSDAMVVGKGYTVQAAATAIPVHFTGTFNTGAQNSGALSRGTSADAGWHLLGNPYPSPLDWSTVTAAQRPGMDAAMYVYQATSQYNGSYRSYVNGVGTSPLIDAGSGYFVRTLAAGVPGAVNLTNANRVTTFGPQPAFGRGTADVRPQLQLQVAGAGLTDLTHLYFENGATAALDAEYDATKLANPHGLNLASLVGQQAVAINGLPTLAGTRETVIPLTLAAPAAGSFTFTVPMLANFGGTTVWLRDALTGTQQQLVAGGSYQFTLATALSGTGRFALAFRPTGALAAATALDAASVRVFPNPAHGRFTLLLPPVADQRAVQAELLNTLGQTVTTRTIGLTAAGASAEFETAALAKGVYMLRLTAGSRTLTQRVVVE